MKEKYRAGKDLSSRQGIQTAELEKRAKDAENLLFTTAEMHQEMTERYTQLREDYLLLQESQGNLAEIIGEMAVRRENASLEKMYQALGLETPMQGSKTHINALDNKSQYK